MKIIISLTLLCCLCLASTAQITKVSLQASGLTCSMCSKAVTNALQDVPYVDKVQVDIKNQEYKLSFKDKASISLDELKKAVEDAGFSVASMKVTAVVNNLKLEKDVHVQIGNEYFHFLNAAAQQLNGNITFSIVDKQFVSDKQYKKYSAASSMECVQTGRTAKCCASDKLAAHTRIYHAII